MPQQELLKQVLSILNENHIDYMVTGSIVSSIQGEPRTTHDVDILVNIKSEHVSALLKAFSPPKFYLSEIAIKEALVHKSMFNLIDTEEGTKIDFWILSNGAFDKSRFERKYEESVLGTKMKISKPEDTILAKILWAKLSGGSEKQFTDALRVYEIQYLNLDLQYITRWSNHLDIDELWEKLKNQADPIE